MAHRARAAALLPAAVVLSAALQGLAACATPDRGHGPAPAGATLLDSGAPGPLLFVVAGIHGDEPSGALAAAALLRREGWLGGPACPGGPSRGSILVLPRANPPALDASSRAAPGAGAAVASGRDLNRLFPGDPGGGAEESRAAAIFSAALRADLVLDLHEEGGAWLEADLPTLVISPAAAAFALPLLEALAARGSPFAYTGGAPAGSLVGALGERGRAAIGVEVPARLPTDERTALQLAVVDAAALLLGLGGAP